MHKKPLILWNSQSISIHTGYGVVAKEILAGLHNTGKYDIISCSWYDPIAEQPEYPYQSAYAKSFPYKVVTPAAAGNEHVDLRHGKKNIKELISIYKPDITIFFADIYMFQYLLDIPETSYTHLVIYYPVDGLPLPPEWLAVLRKADTVITYNKFGEIINKTFFPNNSHMIYHGIDYGFWSKPVPDFLVQAKKKEMFGTDDVIVWGAIARNNPRKNLPAFYQAFAEHAKAHPKSRLFMHCCNIDFGWNMTRLAQEYQIVNKVYLTPGLTASKGVSEEELRLLTNCMDYHVNTATGEGFGVPIITSLAAGVPGLVTDSTVANEFIKEPNTGECIKVGLYTTEPQSHVRRPYIDTRDLFTRMNKLYDNKYDKTINKYDKLHYIYSKNARKFAANFDWSLIIPQWETVLDNIIANNKQCNIQSEVL